MQVGVDEARHRPIDEEIGDGDRRDSAEHGQSPAARGRGRRRDVDKLDAVGLLVHGVSGPDFVATGKASPKARHAEAMASSRAGSITRTPSGTITISLSRAMRFSVRLTVSIVRPRKSAMS